MNGRPGVEAEEICVEKRLAEVSAELGKPVDCLAWPRDGDRTMTESFMAGGIPLRI